MLVLAALRASERSAVDVWAATVLRNVPGFGGRSVACTTIR